MDGLKLFNDVLRTAAFIQGQQKMIASGGNGRTGKEAVTTYFRALFLHSSGGTEESTVKSG
jgi:hypothetical protein